ncbi:9226_t:CDS:2 [Dentiscutata erythropus]|uniref:9226_t:CDS:1 n=1 Tax=Dentiscutata erythropus TaxID=1348616 RepID=A0A9N9AAU8_9GLOM|nr:9226_t:CDS:2 [Dentiscutata erythropus]
MLFVIVFNEHSKSLYPYGENNGNSQTHWWRNLSDTDVGITGSNIAFSNVVPETIILGDDLSCYSPDEECSNSEESKALTIKQLSIASTLYKIDHKFPDLKYRFNLKARGPDRFVAWWSENHPGCQITVDSIKRWTYREDEDPSRYNIHWKEYGD